MATAGVNMRVGIFDFYNPGGLLNKTGVKTKDRNGIGFQISSDKTGPTHFWLDIISI